MKPTPGQTADTLHQIEQLAARLRALEPQLRAHETTLDGYPRQSGPGGGAGQGDPVGTIVTLRLDQGHHDPIAHAHTQLLDHVHQARRLLEAAESAGRQALPRTTPTPDNDGCVSCARIKTWSPITRTRRCRFCYDYLRAEGEDPPIDFLRAHHDGRRLTTRLVDTLTRHRRRQGDVHG